MRRHAQCARYDAATAHLDPPLAIIDCEAFDRNATRLVDRAAGKPLRVASKSVRSRELIRRVLARPGWHGIMAYALPEALWLAGAGVSDDIVMAYPTVDRAALATLTADPALAAAITIMIDDPAQLDLVDAIAHPDRRPPLRVCVDLDASWRPSGRLHLGVRRSPVHSPEAAARLAATIVARRRFTLVGLMAYEAQIAGLGDAPAGQPVRGALIRAFQSRSAAELRARRAAAVEAVRRHADLEFVNGGGTGSVAGTAADPAVTEITAGSGLYGPALFDGYRSWRPEPAAFYALPVVRRPNPRTATLFGGGWVASGPAGASRLPKPWLPTRLKLLSGEGAGEVQTPVVGPDAHSLRVGERVWLRHAKAGELCEHVNELHLVQGETVGDSVATYRGEGRAFG